MLDLILQEHNSYTALQTYTSTIVIVQRKYEKMILRQTFNCYRKTILLCLFEKVQCQKRSMSPACQPVFSHQENMWKQYRWCNLFFCDEHKHYNEINEWNFVIFLHTLCNFKVQYLYSHNFKGPICLKCLEIPDVTFLHFYVWLFFWNSVF